MCEAGRGVFEDKKVHDENNEVSGKSEALRELNNMSTCPGCGYFMVVFDPFKKHVFWTLGS